MPKRIPNDIKMIKKIISRLVLVLLNFAILYFLYITGIRAIIGFVIGVFVGACVVIYWSMSKNGFLSFIVKDMVKNKEVKELDKQKTRNNKNT